MTVFQISAKPAAKYHKEYICHITPFSLLYCLISVIWEGSTSEPAQNHIGFFNFRA